ncbi:MAG: hypothetical protein MGF17_02950 [Trichodesmium sp. MAG_R04]|nr:hypothetical protein [Trichodesmium sp. MAG_R04]
MKLVLKGAQVSMTETIPDSFEVTISLPYGHVMVILETIKTLGLDKIITFVPSRLRNLIVGMITAIIIKLKSRLATERYINSKICSNSHSLAQVLNLEKVDKDELSDVVYWLLSQQEKIEESLQVYV